MAGRGKPGPARTKLVKSELDAILAHLEAGHGRMRACRLADVNYRTFARRLDECPELRDRVVQAERARAEDMVKVLYDLRVHEDASVQLAAAKAYLHRDDRQREARRALRERKASAGEAARAPVVAAMLPRIADLVMDFCDESRHVEMLAAFDRLSEEMDELKIG